MFPEVALFRVHREPFPWPKVVRVSLSQGFFPSSLPFRVLYCIPTLLHFRGINKRTRAAGTAEEDVGNGRRLPDYWAERCWLFTVCTNGRRNWPLL